MPESAAVRRTSPPDWSARTVEVRDRTTFAGWRRAGPALLRDGAGNLTWILRPPERRTWTDSGVLADAAPVPWTLEQDGQATVLRSAEHDAVVDLVELRGQAAVAFERDRSVPMTVVPSFEPLTGPDGLADYLVGGHVLTGEHRIKWPVEQANLSLYRIARARGGAFWDGVAEHVAAVTAARIEAAPGGRPVSDHWGKGETHVRFLADAALLLAAHSELTGEARYLDARERAAAALESFGVPLAGGVWYLHDSVEEGAGRNDLVLNTHVHALTVLHACGRSIAAGLLGLRAMVGPRMGGARAAAVAVAVAVADLGLAFAPPRPAQRVAAAAHARLAALTAGRRALRLPGGFVARDTSGAPAPLHYLIVNLADLAVLQRNTPVPEAGSALASGLRYARRSGFVRAQVRLGDRLAVLMPGALRNAGRAADAERLAHALGERGLAPMVGWPGYEDRLWSALAPGTP